jgi:hypothetical protein
VIVVVLAVVVPVVALTVARSLADHWLIVLVKELAISLFLLCRWLFLGGRFIVRYVRGEARTWSIR